MEIGVNAGFKAHVIRVKLVAGTIACGNYV